MLRRISVNGFKSLLGFDLRLRPGLNVLVGPNGAGKSNIIKFLEFISDLTDRTISEAVSRSGGAGEIFHRRSDGILSSEFDFSISGSGVFRRSVFRSDNPESQNIPIHYGYSATVKLTENSVFFKSQSVRINLNKSKRSKPDIWIRTNYRENTGKASLKFISFKQDELESSGYIISNAKEFISSVIGDQASVDTALFYNLAYLIEPFQFIVQDVDTGRAYNINPTKVRESEDIAQQGGISADGGGLSSTLLAVKRAGDRHVFGFRKRGPSFTQSMYDQIQEYVRLVSPDIVRLDARADHIENKNRAFVTFVDKDQLTEFPISFVSDGTAKWFALIIAMVTSRTTFCIEEPENFIHPKLQEEVVAIARAISETAPDERFALMTTHSQTLLNALFPSEIIVVRRDGRATSCTRIADVNAIDRLINETGFGLGYFYITGSIG